MIDDAAMVEVTEPVDQKTDPVLAAVAEAVAHLGVVVAYMHCENYADKYDAACQATSAMECLTRALSAMNT